MDVDAARQAIVQAGLEVFVQYASSGSVAAGSVLSQSPVSGTTVAPNTVVTLTVSSGPASTVSKVSVPNLVGLYWKDAGDLLASRGLSLDKYVWAVDAAAPGTVIAQSINPAHLNLPGTKLQLTLSAGPARVASTVAVPVAS